MFTSKYLGISVGALMFLSMAMTAQASVLSQTQINAIVGLLQSFGADQTTIDKVSTALGSTLPSESGTCVTLTRDLTLGSKGVDVARLQNYLIAKGYLASGNNTGYYGYLTASAVGKLQMQLGIIAAGNSNDAAYGIMGPKTRAAITCGSVTGSGTLSASPTSGVAPLTVTFTLPGIHWGDAAPPPVTLNFGDNTSGTMTASNSCTSSGFDCVLTYSATHSYASAGTYRPTTTVSGRIYMATVLVTGTQSATFSATPTSGTAPLTVTFNGVLLTGGSDYIFDFGDGANSGTVQAPYCAGGPNCSAITAAHTYVSSGTYTAVLSPVVTCPSNATCQAQAPLPIGTVVITVTGTQSTTLSASPTSGVAPLTVSFTGSNFVPGSYTITYGDGTTVPAVTASGCTSQCPIGTSNHTYAMAGTYTAQAASELPGGSVAQSPVITVTNATAGPTCTMSASPTSVLVGQPYTISWSSQNAASMSVSGPNISSTALSGSQSVTVDGIGGAPTATENYTGTVKDSVGHTSTCSTSVTVSQNSILPNALVSMRGVVTLNGTNQYLALPPLPDATAFTVGAWVKYTGSSCGVILSDATTAAGNDMALGTDGSNLYVLGDKSGASLATGVTGCGYDLVQVPLSTSIAGAWHHVSWRNAGSSSTLYVDGKVVGTVNLSGSNVGYHNSAAQVGRIDDGGTWYKASPQLFKGSIGDLRYYATVLTAAQIAQIVSAGLQYNTTVLTPSTI